MRIPKSLGIVVSIAIPVCVTGSQEPGPAVIPQGLWAAQVSPTVLRLAWNAVPGAQVYRISCAQGSKPERVLGSMLSGQPATYANGVPRRASYAMPLNQKDGPIEYRCFLEWGTVTGKSFNKAAFNPVTATLVSSEVVRTTPAYVTATSASENEITLTWAPVAGATAYTINREVAPLGFSVFCDMCSTASTSIVDRFVEKSRKHRYFVTPITPMGARQRGTSNYVVPGYAQDTTPITPGTPISPPASVTATVTGRASAKVSWIAIRGPIAYEVSRFVEGRAPSRVARVPNDLTGVLIQVPDILVKETRDGAIPVTVRYEVRSVDAGGKVTEPATSNTITVSAKDAAAAALASRNVTNARATAMSASSVMLTWTPPSGGLYLCDLQRSLSGGVFEPVSRVPTGAYRYVDEMPDLMAKAPAYRIRCSSGKLPLPAVAFPNPTPAG